MRAQSTLTWQQLKRAGAMGVLVFGLLGPTLASGQEPPGWNPQYDLTVRVDTVARVLHVAGTWRLPAARADRDSVEFLLWSRMQDLKVEVVEPAGFGGVVLTGAGDGDRRWVLRGNAPFPRDREVVLKLSYHSGGPPSPQFKIAPGGSFAGGGGELWYPQTKFGKRDTGRLRFLVPPGDRVVSTGSLVAKTLADSASIFVYETRDPVKFSFAAGPYHVLEAAAGDLTLSLLTLGDHSGSEALLTRLADGLRALRDAFGPLPITTLSLVEVDFESAVSGTSENGFILADRTRMLRGIDLPFWLHEMAHQWWGVRLHTRSGTPGRMLMSEGMAELGMTLAMEQIEGADAGRRLRKGEYPGVGDSPRKYFEFAAAGLDLPLTTLPKGGRETVLVHQLAISRGALLLDMLARRVGYKRFLTVSRSLMGRASQGPTSWKEFRQALGENDNPELSRFLQAWFDRTGAPEIELQWNQHGTEIRGRVVQESADGCVRPFSIEIEARAGNESARRVLAIDHRDTPFVWDPGFVADSVVLDPDYRTLRWVPEWKAEAEALATVTRAEFERRFGDRAEAITLFSQAVAALDTEDPYGVRFRAEFGLGRALESDGDMQEARRHLEAALAAYIRPADLLPQAYLALARVAGGLQDGEALRTAALQAIASDRELAATTGATFEATKLLAEQQPGAKRSKR